MRNPVLLPAQCKFILALFFLSLRKHPQHRGLVSDFTREENSKETRGRDSQQGLQGLVLAVFKLTLQQSKQMF